MPFKHHIPRMSFKVTNWADYDRGLVQRGDIRFWIDEEAIKAWIAPYRTTPGGQRKFSNFAIEATLVLGAVFKMPLRQTEGFVRSLMELMGLDLPVPDHTTLARRRRTVAIDMRAPGRKSPVDLVLDRSGNCTARGSRRSGPSHRCKQRLPGSEWPGRRKRITD